MYNINPERNNAQIARHAYTTKVKKSILYLINECSSKLNFHDKKMMNVLSKLENLEVLSPQIHYRHHALQHNMRKNDIEGVKISLTELMNVILDVSNESFQVSTILGSDWEEFAVTEALKLTQVDCGLIAEIKPIDSDQLSDAKDKLFLALSLIARHDPDMFDEIQTHVGQIKIFDGKVTMGLTDVRIMGSMFIRIPRSNVDPVLYFIEHIIHEASHIHLNSIMVIDPLFLNSPDEKFISPIRRDLRPMIGVFHATYVSARIVRYFFKLYKIKNDKKIQQHLAETLDETIRGVREIEKNCKLTSNGKMLIESIKKMVDTIKIDSTWKTYDFDVPHIHRFGIGQSKVSELKRAVL
jgi:hypothetical protein